MEEVQASRLGKGGKGYFLRQKLETCLPFCENFQYFLPNFLRLHGKFWQKLDFHALFAIFPAESRIKTFFINKISLELDECSVLGSVSAGKSYEPLSAKILRFAAEFLSPRTFQNNRKP
jgi:hypothetical protein